MNLQELKQKNPGDLIKEAEKLGFNHGWIYNNNNYKNPPSHLKDVLQSFVQKKAQD